MQAESSVWSQIICQIRNQQICQAVSPRFLGSDPDFSGEKNEIRRHLPQDERGRSPLHLAAAQGHQSPGSWLKGKIMGPDREKPGEHRQK